MSRYSSLCKAINVMEAMAKLMNDNGRGDTQTGAVIRDLQDIAKDVRYGGEWHGDFEVIAQALTCCVNPGTNCAVCPYRKMHTNDCIISLKRDAISAIRQMGKDLKKTRQKLKLAEDILHERDRETKMEVAPWQVEDMENGNEPPKELDLFPWDEEEAEMAPAEEGGVF